MRSLRSVKALLPGCLSVLALAEACSGSTAKDRAANMNSQPPVAALETVCGSVGSSVSIRVNSDTCTDALIAFPGGGKSAGTVTGEGRNWVVTATVPTGAVSGALSVHNCKNALDVAVDEDRDGVNDLKYTTASAFTIPCPSDAGNAPDATPGVDGSIPGTDPPTGIVTALSTQLALGPAMASGSAIVYEPTDAGSVQAYIAQRLAFVGERTGSIATSAPWTTAGSCGTVTAPAAPDGASDVGATIEIREGANTVLTLNRNGTNSYSSLPGGSLPLSVPLNVFFGGATGFPQTTVTGVWSRQGTPIISSPDFGAGVTVTAGQPLIVTHGSSCTGTDAAMILDFIVGPTTTRCGASSTGGTTTIPNASLPKGNGQVAATCVRSEPRTVNGRPMRLG